MTNAALGLLDGVADAMTRLAYLEKKSHDDDEMLALLIKQKDDLASELADANHNSGVEIYRLEQERDAAVKVSREVRMIIETGSALMLSGLRKMVGDGTPEKLPAKAVPELDDPRIPPVQHLQAAPKRLPPMTPEQKERLPLHADFSAADPAPLFLSTESRLGDYVPRERNHHAPRDRTEEHDMRQRGSMR